MVAALALVVARPRLTGVAWLDVVELVGAAVLLTQFARRATWSVVGLAVVAMAAASGVVALALAVLALATAVGGVLGRAPALRVIGVTAAIVVVSGATADTPWWVGFAVAGAVAVLVVEVAVDRRNRGTWQRRTARALGLAMAGLVLVGLVSAARLVVATRDLRRSLGTAIDAARGGDVDVASSQLTRAAQRCRTVHDSLSGLGGLSWQLVPGVGGHVGPLRHFASLCGSDLQQVASTVTTVRASFATTKGVYDLAAVGRLPSEISSARTALADLSTAARAYLASLPLPRPPGGIEARLVQIDRAGTRLADLESLAAKLPALLGADRTRRYLVMYLTPAEGRPLGGFMGNWSMVRAEGGHVSVERSGRTADLSLTNYGGKKLTGLDDYRSRYEAYLGGGVNTPLDPDIWLLFTVTPDLPTAGEVARQLAPQSGIGTIDGVITVDIDAIAHLLALIPPVTVPELGTSVDPHTARQLLLVDQYRVFTSKEARVSFLQHLGDELTKQMTEGDLGLTKVAAALRGDVQAGGVGVWLVNADEQAAARQAQIAPSFPPPDGHDGFILSTTNRSPNKLDSFLQRSISYDAVVDARGNITGRGTVTLTNTFDPAAEPGYGEANNSQGDPNGSVREITCFHTPHQFSDASAPISDTEYLGWHEACTELVVPAGGTVQFWVEVEGGLDHGTGYCFVSRGQITGMPDKFHLRVRHPDGSVVVDTDLDGPKAKWLIGPGCPAAG